MSESLRNLGSFDDFIAQRRDAVGADGSTVPIDGFGRVWHIAVPNLQPSDWNDEFQDLVEDATEGFISTSDYRNEISRLLLGDQADDFKTAADEAGVDPLTLLNWFMQEMAEETSVNPTRKNSSGGRKRAKRR